MNERKAILTCSTKYQKAPLQYPLSDVTLVSNTIKKRCLFSPEDINTIIHTNEDKDDAYLEGIKRACEKLNSQRTNSYDLILFYYSGHGIYNPEDKASHLQISDNYSISIEEIVEAVSKVKAKNKYFIVDACQCGGFSLKQAKGKIHRQYSFNSQGVYCMFGTTLDLLAFEPTMKESIRKRINNSFFTHFITEALNTKSIYIDDTISIRAVDDYASKKTPSYTNFEQIPYSATEIAGYFPFGVWKEAKELTDISDWDLKTKDDAPEVLNVEVDIVNYLYDRIQACFTDSSSWIAYDKQLLGDLTQPAKDLLNAKLDLPSKKFDGKPLINGLIGSKDPVKIYFLRVILSHDEINVDLTLKSSQGNTCLYEAVFNCTYNKGYIVQLLFIAGYKLQKEEESFLTGIYNEPSIYPGDVLESIAIANFCNKLNDIEKIKKISDIERVLFSLLSLKENKVIGFKFKNLTGLVNNFLNSYGEYSDLCIKALRVYHHYDNFMKITSTSKKINDLRQNKPYQEDKFNEIFRALFAELFD